MGESSICVERETHLYKQIPPPPQMVQVCSAEELTDEIGAMIQGVVFTLPEGSLTQRVQVRFRVVWVSVVAGRGVWWW